MAKSFDSRQPARTAQAGVNRNFLLIHLTPLFPENCQILLNLARTVFSPSMINEEATEARALPNQINIHLIEDEIKRILRASFYYVSIFYSGMKLYTFVFMINAGLSCYPHEIAIKHNGTMFS